MRYFLWFLAAIMLLSTPLRADVRQYEFDIDYITLNKSGALVRAMAIGGSVPAPLIEARLGDTLEVTFHNKMDVESSVHWHGILLPSDQDGVPWLNTRPIGPGESFTFRFDIKHTGTYWYHSHTGLQEQRGIYGPIRLLPAESKLTDMQDTVLVWSDWSDENPKQILRNLKRDGHWYARQKDSVQGWDRVIKHGWSAIKNRLKGNWTRMGPMDLSDIAYDAFLANGDAETQLTTAKPGETVRVRMVNAAASSYFNIEYAGGPMTVVAADGVDVQPFKVKRLEHALAETWDVEIVVPESGNFELRATNVDGSGQTSAWIGDPADAKVYAPDIPKPNPFAVDHSAHQMQMAEDGDVGSDDCAPEHAAMGHCTPMASPDGGTIDHLTDYAPLKARASTALNADMPLRKVHLKLTGNMERYIWSFNGETLSEADRIMIRKGERVQFIFENTTMMNHPLHLHGHFFRVLNGQGDFAPLKHTIDLASMSSVTIEFEANEERDWIFHCHNLYHMKTGMSRVISYTDTSDIDDAFAQSLSMDDHWYKFADIAALSNQHMGRLWAVNNRYGVEAEWEGDYDGTLEAEVKAEYFQSRFTELFVGAELEREDGESETLGFVGASMVLPLLIESGVQVDTSGHVKLMVGGDVQLANRVKFHWKWDTDNDYAVSLDYEITKRLSVIAQYDNDFDFGVGLKARF